MIPSAAQPIGPLVDPRPAKRPERVTLPGRAVTLVPLDAEAHANSLFHKANGGERDRVWTYLFDGPYADPRVFKASLAAKAQSEDPLFFAIIDNASGEAVGYQTFLRIEPAHRVIEVGNILYTPAMQRRSARPKRNICSPPMSSTNSAIAATNGSAIISTRPRSARRCATASASRAPFGNT